MKRILITAFVLAVLFTGVSRQNVLAQATTPAPSTAAGIMPLLPGIQCGNAVAENPEARKCCSNQSQFANNTSYTDMITRALSDVTGVVSLAIPFIGKNINDFMQPLFNVKDYALQLQRDASPIACPLGYPSTLDKSDPTCTCLTAITPTPAAQLKEFCSKYNFRNAAEQGACNSCAQSAGVWTGIGCVYGDVGEFLRRTVFSFAIGLAGGFALICILYAAFRLQTSQGNPEKIKKSQELLTSCIMGLMLIIFSVFILKLIGVDILKIPGFGG